MDITLLSLTVLCTSLVWHSSGNLKDMDGFLSRFLAYYAFASSGLSLKVAGPLAILLAYVLTFEAEIQELALAVPLLVCLIVLKVWDNSFSVPFLFALIFGGVGVVCYYIEEWHVLWHVMGAVAVALTVEKSEVIYSKLDLVDQEYEVKLRL